MQHPQVVAMAALAYHVRAPDQGWFTEKQRL